MKWFLVVLSILMVSCAEASKEASIESVDIIGKYIYRDDNDIHHIDPDCMKLRHGKDDSGHDIFAKHMMDTAEFIIVEPEYFRVCSRCVSDKSYEHILRISENNSAK
jgi:hypothetical protein